MFNLKLIAITGTKKDGCVEAVPAVKNIVSCVTGEQVVPAVPECPLIPFPQRDDVNGVMTMDVGSRCKCATAFRTTLLLVML